MGAHNLFLSSSLVAAKALNDGFPELRIPGRKNKRRATGTATYQISTSSSASLHLASARFVSDGPVARNNANENLHFAKQRSRVIVAIESEVQAICGKEEKMVRKIQEMEALLSDLERQLELEESKEERRIRRHFYLKKKIGASEHINTERQACSPAFASSRSVTDNDASDLGGKRDPVHLPNIQSNLIRQKLVEGHNPRPYLRRREYIYNKPGRQRQVLEQGQSPPKRVHERRLFSPARRLCDDDDSDSVRNVFPQTRDQLWHLREKIRKSIRTAYR